MVKKFIRRNKSRPYKKRKQTVPKNVKMYVKRSIQGVCENKQAYHSVSTNYITAFNVSGTLLAAPLHPYAGSITIPQNVGSSDRIGNKIRVVKAMFNYILNPEVYNASLNPSPTPNIVKLWIGYDKRTPLVPTPSAPNFIQTGNTSSTLTGYLIDVVKPVNKDCYKIYKTRTHKIGHSSETGSGSSAIAGYQSNNDFKMNAIGKIDITRYLQKNVQFNDTTNTQTNGHGLFAYWTAVRADGLTNGVQPINMSYWIDFYYEDA